MNNSMNNMSGGMVVQEVFSPYASSESALVEQFTAQLLGAQRSMHQNHPWVMVTTKHKSQTLLAVYQQLKMEGAMEEWSSEFYQVRENSGLCVLALIP
ncbi:MAG: hypothetical protein ACFCU8_11280 [Thermosynechococcaceae cyanobacterium]